MNNKSSEEIEAQLRSLVPTPLSDEVEKRIAQQLVETDPTRNGKRAVEWFVRLVAMGMGIALFTTWWIPQPRHEVPKMPAIAGKRLAGSETMPPTMLSYQRIFEESPEKLNDLLVKHATTLLAEDAVSIQALYDELLRD